MSGQDSDRRWPLIGREDEVRAVEEALRQRTASLAGVLLTGDRGVGKSRIAEEAGARFRAAGFRVTRLWDRVAKPGRTVLVVDDVHRLDPESASTLADLAARRVVFLVGTATGRVPEALTALWTAGRLLTLPILPLAPNAMDQLIRGLPSVRLDPIARRYLAEASGGNPLALQALLDPDGMGRALTEQWLDEAGPAGREIVELVACADPMPLRLLEQLAEAAAIDAAERAGKVRVSDTATGLMVQVAPPLSAVLVRKVLTRTAQARIRRTVPLPPAAQQGPARLAPAAECLSRLMGGDLHGAQELADEGYDKALATSARDMAAVWSFLGGSIAKAQGLPYTATVRLEDALMMLPPEDPAGLRAVCLAELAAASALTGDAAQARAWLTRSDGHPVRPAAFFEPWLVLARAWSCAADGNLSRAVDLCRHAAELAAEQGLPAQEATALYDVARLGAPNTVHTRLADLAELAPQTDSEAVAIMAIAAQGLARRDENALGRAADAFAALGFTLLAAETATAAAHARHLRGRHASAALLHERAEALTRLCEGAQTPLLDRRRLRTRLTPREREVVLLAPTATTPQIAARLGLSPRTVSNYLQRAYDKLGLTGRAELRVFLITE